MTPTNAELAELLALLRGRAAYEGKRQVGRMNNARAILQAADHIEALAADVEITGTRLMKPSEQPCRGTEKDVRTSSRQLA